MPAASVREIILEYIFPGLGVIIGNCMFSAPYKDFQAAVQGRGALGDLNPTPWAFMLGNCCGWVVYSILVQNLWIFFGNAPGFCLSIWLNMGAAKLQYHTARVEQILHALTNGQSHQHKEDEEAAQTTTRPNGESSSQEEENSRTTKGSTANAADSSLSNNNKNDGNKNQYTKLQESSVNVHHPKMDSEELLWKSLMESSASLSTSRDTSTPASHERVVLIIAMIWVACIALISFASDFSHTTKEWIVGILVNLNLVFFYGAPLSTIWQVLQTRNSASIHIPTMITNTANGTFWGVYGLAILDPFVAVPNGLGTALGVIQIVLVLTFPRIPLQKEKENKTTTTVSTTTDHMKTNE